MKNEKIYQKEIALTIERQEFEENSSRKKLLLHYFFNILEHIYAKSLPNHSDKELLDKVRFVLYHFLIDVEKEKIELDKELVFYKYYIELECLRYQYHIFVNFNVCGQTKDFTIIPLLFEPLIDNAMKHTKRDGSGWVDIEVDTSHFPVLIFHCKNNYCPLPSNTSSFESGLKILEQRLELCYKNNYTLKVTQNDDLYEVSLSIKTV